MQGRWALSGPLNCLFSFELAVPWASTYANAALNTDSIVRPRLHTQLLKSMRQLCLLLQVIHTRSMVFYPCFCRQIHKGFKIMADEFWDTGLKDVLTREFVNGPGAMRHITIAGHSLGAAVATLLTARAQKFLQEQCASKPAWQAWPKKQPLVTGVMFAAPHVGDSAFTQDFDARVNARRVVFEYDLTSQVRCAAAHHARPCTAAPGT